MRDEDVRHLRTLKSVVPRGERWLLGDHDDPSLVAPVVQPGNRKFAEPHAVS